MNGKAIGRPCPELVFVLDFIFGVDGGLLANKPVWEVLDKVSNRVFPCPSFDELEDLLKTSPPISVTTSSEEHLATLNNFFIKDNGYVGCNVVLEGKPGLDESQLSRLISNVLRCAVQDYLVIVLPEETHSRHLLTPSYGF